MSIYTLRSGASQHPEDSVLQSITDLISASGVVDITNNHFKVSAQSSPDMTVQVASGRAYLKATGTNAYPVRSDASANATIGANSSGNPRKDSIVLYVDKAAVPNTDASNVAKIAVVAGTPAASPTAPDSTAIATAIGSANPYLVLADVTVSSGATSIVSGNITDRRAMATVNLLQPVINKLSSTPATPASGFATLYEDANKLLKYLNEDGTAFIVGETGWITLTDGATVTIDLATGKKFKLLNMAGNRTLQLANEYVGKDFMIMLGNDASNRTPSWFHYDTTFATTDVNTGTDVITVGRNIPTGVPIKFTSTTTLPTGLSAGTRYYAINVSSTTIKVATSYANAQAGTAVDITGAGAGTHTVQTHIRWTGGNVEPTPTTGAYAQDTFGISILATGIYEGYTVGQDG